MSNFDDIICPPEIKEEVKRRYDEKYAIISNIFKKERGWILLIYLCSIFGLVDGVSRIFHFLQTGEIFLTKFLCGLLSIGACAWTAYHIYDLIIIKLMQEFLEVELRATLRAAKASGRIN